MGTAGIRLVWPETPGCHSVRWAGDQRFLKGWEPWGRDKPAALRCVGSIAEPYSVPALWEGEGDSCVSLVQVGGCTEPAPLTAAP